MRHEITAIAGGRVRDIGYADAWPRKWLPGECDYMGLDYSSTGAELYGAEPDVFADASQIPLADKTIGIVLAFEVVEHLRFVQEAMKEMARVLKPKGQLFTTLPFLYPIHDAPYHFQRHTEHGLVCDLEAAGIKLSSFGRAWVLQKWMVLSLISSWGAWSWRL